MSPAPLLALLGVTFLLPGMQALDCQWGAIESVLNASTLPVEWTSSRTTCEIGEGCQDTLMLIENGPQVNLVLTKGCTEAEDQEAQVTEHRAGPGLSVLSYTRVCRHKDLCNDLSTSAPLWTPELSTVPGTLRCPVCFSKYGCPANGPDQLCPAGHTHCYNGVLRLRGGGITTNLRVQGCMPQPGCNLLNGTQQIGPMDVSENCNTKPGVQALECKKGAIETVRDASELPLQWTTGWESCAIGDGCQETVILMMNGPKINLVLTKGCTKAKDQEAKVTWHRAGPGLSVLSYTRVCRHGDLCNDVPDTDAFWSPPAAAVPGTLRCPVCFSKYGCPANGPDQLCPAGHTHCYNGVLRLRGGGITTNLKVKGCMPQPGCNLLNGTQQIGPMDVSENCDPIPDPLTCHRGTMVQMKSGLAEEPVEWTSPGSQLCEVGEVCQETLLLIDVGQRSLLAGSKGCSRAGAQDSQTVSIHSRPPGVLVASYARFCSSDLCNGANNSRVLLTSLPKPAAPAPGDLRCPVCVQPFGSCSPNSNFAVCPNGTTHCYNGYIALGGGGLSSQLGVQGCMAPTSRSLLNGSQTIGIFSVMENNFEDNGKNKPLLPDGASSVPFLGCVVGLGLFLALWGGGLALPLH